MLAILKVRGFDEDVELGYYLVEEGGNSPLEKLRAAAVEGAESDRSWESIDLPYTWGDFLCMGKEDILLKHGVKRVTLTTPGVGLMIDSITEIEVDGTEILVENSRMQKPERFEFEPYASCGLAAVSLCWVEDKRIGTKTYFFLVNPELKGQAERLLKEAAIEFLLSEEGASCGDSLTWDELFGNVTADYFELHGLMHVTNTELKQLDPHIVWLESIPLGCHCAAICAGNLA